jgi:hypothetical protein
MDKTINTIINELSNKIIIIENSTETKEDYQSMVESFYNYIKAGFEHKELRECPVHFRFFEKEGEEIHTLQLRHFVTNLFFWEPIVRMGVYERIDASYIIDCTILSNDLIKSYIDNKIIIPFRTSIGNKKMNVVIHDMIYNIARISTDFNALLGLSMNAETFIDMSKKNKRFNEIIRTKIPDNMQPNEIEKYLLDLTDEQIEILKEEDNFLRPMLRAGTGIKAGQFKEFAVNGGLKPDLDGNTIPIPVNSNFVVGGLNSVSNYYIDSLGGRKSLIMNKTVMGRSGHFARMIMLLSSPVKMRHDEEDCGTVHPVLMNVKTGKHLSRLRGRYYRLQNSREYKLMTGDEKHLIGQDILLRSPVTCASKKICKKCYGLLYYTNKDLESIGGYAGSKITEPLSQSILSSKHLLTTQSEKIEFEGDFDKFFTINANEIMLNESNEDIEFERYSLLVIRKNISMIEEFDDNEFNSFVNLFHVVDNKTGEMIELQEKDEKDLFITPELKGLLKKSKTNKGVLEVGLDKLADDIRIFVVEISNNELTKPLYNIMDLLNNQPRRERAGVYTIDHMVQRMLDLLIESKIVSDSVHGELLIRPLIRSKKDILEIPDFTKYRAKDEYNILTVVNALTNHPSVTISLSFQDISRQLVNPNTFRKKDSSFIDAFFRERP